MLAGGTVAIALAVTAAAQQAAPPIVNLPPVRLEAWRAEMAESPSSALPGGVEWLPALGGARLLRAEVRGEPPALILTPRTGAEHRIEPGPEARFDATTTYSSRPAWHCRAAR